MQGVITSRAALYCSKTTISDFVHQKSSSPDFIQDILQIDSYRSTFDQLPQKLPSLLTAISLGFFFSFLFLYHLIAIHQYWARSALILLNYYTKGSYKENCYFGPNSSQLMMAQLVKYNTYIYMFIVLYCIYWALKLRKLNYSIASETNGSRGRNG